MDTKKVIQDTIAGNEDIFEKILFFAKQKSWIFISEGLNKRLKEEYENYLYACVIPKGNIFLIKKEDGEWKMYVDTGSCWNKVALLINTDKKHSTESLYLASDPERIVFLSEAE